MFVILYYSHEKRCFFGKFSKYVYLQVQLCDLNNSVKGSYPYMLQVQGNVPDKRLDESLLQPELLLSLIKGFIFNLGKRQTTKTKRDQNKHVFIRDCQAVFPPLSLRSWLGAAMYLG